MQEADGITFDLQSDGGNALFDWSALFFLLVIALLCVAFIRLVRYMNLNAGQIDWKLLRWGVPLCVLVFDGLVGWIGLAAGEFANGWVEAAIFLVIFVLNLPAMPTLPLLGMFPDSPWIVLPLIAADIFGSWYLVVRWLEQRALNCAPLSLFSDSENDAPHS